MEPCAELGAEWSGLLRFDRTHPPLIAMQAGALLVAFSETAIKTAAHHGAQQMPGENASTKVDFRTHGRRSRGSFHLHWAQYVYGIRRPVTSI